MESSSELSCIYQLRIILRGLRPLIWRRLLVYSDATLAQLHAMLQILFERDGEHLHEFHNHGSAWWQEVVSEVQHF